MTVPEAIAALAAAPMDEGVSAVDPTRSRRKFTLEVKGIVDQHGMAISLSPSTAKMVAQAVQDCKFPVPMRFMYDKEGKLAVGWNREEIEIRKAALTDVYYHKTLAEQEEKPKKKVVFDFANHALDAAGMGITGPYYSTSLDQYLAQEQERAAIKAGIRQDPAPPKKPEPPPEPEPPKPDPKSPKFVLKRPKA